MTLTELLKQEASHSYAVTEALFRLVDAGQLEWKPATGRNWMSVGQLLHHCSEGCGAALRGFVTGDWGLPEGQSFEDLPPDQQLPPAEAMPRVDSVEQALARLAQDRQAAYEALDQAGERRLLTDVSAAPWGGPPLTLFQHLLHMIGHLDVHKGQLFYYLKLQGRDVNTTHLWGA